MILLSDKEVQTKEGEKEEKWYYINKEAECFRDEKKTEMKLTP